MNSIELTEKMIQNMEVKLAETKDDAMHARGPVQDAIRVVIPMMEDQLEIMKRILSHLVATQQAIAPLGRQET